MAEYPNSGVLNANKWKREGTKQPDQTGKAVVTCKHCQKETAFEIAAWIRGGYTTLMFTEKSLAERKRADAKARKAGLPTAAEAAAADSEAEQQEQQPAAGGVVY